ncbi:MAG: integration host factor subunit beta [Treponema sp.]
MSKEKRVKKPKQTKTSIVDMIYKNSDHMLKDVHAITDLFFSEMFQALQRGETIEVRGFGTFSVQFRKGRKGMRNPKTGELVDTVPHSVVVFRPGKILSAAVRPIVQEETPDAKE